MIFGCQHKAVGWPVNNRQRCLTCGQSRKYIIGFGPIGKWESDHDLAQASKREALLIAKRKLEVFRVRP